MKGIIYLVGLCFLISCNDQPEVTISQSETTQDSINQLQLQQQQLEQQQQLKFDSSIRLELSISNREVYVFKGNDTLKKYDIAVGTSKHPTPTGEFKIHQIDWNPDWTPPESEWTKDKSYKKPGEAGNPMGRARIIYQMPYTLHGTKNLKSLGEAESHGSVRLANENIIELARLIMEESGTSKPEDWYQRVLGNPKEMVSVKLNDSIPLVNKK